MFKQYGQISSVDLGLQMATKMGIKDLNIYGDL